MLAHYHSQRKIALINCYMYDKREEEGDLSPGYAVDCGTLPPGALAHQSAKVPS